MNDLIWIEYEDCIAVQEMIIAQFSGTPGLRDAKLLASKLDEPRELKASSDPKLAELAASFASGIILNHPFYDANKRTGFLLAVIFLESNGRTFSAPEELVVEKTLALAVRDIEEKDYALWLSQCAS